MPARAARHSHQRPELSDSFEPLFEPMVPLRPRFRPATALADPRQQFWPQSQSPSRSPRLEPLRRNLIAEDARVRVLLQPRRHGNGNPVHINEHDLTATGVPDLGFITVSPPKRIRRLEISGRYGPALPRQRLAGPVFPRRHRATVRAAVASGRCEHSTPCGWAP
jgi:hypothetical protein